jgi:hypothetical protein
VEAVRHATAVPTVPRARGSEPFLEGGVSGDPLLLLALDELGNSLDKVTVVISNGDEVALKRTKGRQTLSILWQQYSYTSDRRRGQLRAGNGQERARVDIWIDLP